MLGIAGQDGKDTVGSSGSARLHSLGPQLAGATAEGQQGSGGSMAGARAEAAAQGSRRAEGSGWCRQALGGARGRGPGRGGTAAGRWCPVGGCTPSREWAPLPLPIPIHRFSDVTLLGPGHRRARSRTPAPDAIREQPLPGWRVVGRQRKPSAASQNTRLRLPLPGRAIPESASRIPSTP